MMRQNSDKLVRTLRGVALLVCMAGLGTLRADVFCSFNGSTMHVRVPSPHAGERVELLWDETDKGADPALWANKHVIVAAAQGGQTYDVDLAALGIANGTPCRIASFCSYQPLDMLKSSTTAYVDTGILDTAVYGVSFGFYASEKNTDWGYFIGSAESNGFVMGNNNTAFNSWNWAYQTGKKYPRPSVNTDKINTVVFANQTFVLNGSQVANGLPSGAVGAGGNSMRIGRTNDSRIQPGWWSYVRFTDANGKNLIDYIPVQRGDGKVGFYDRVAKKLVLSTGSGNFTAGTATGEKFEEVTLMQSVVPNHALDVSIVGDKLTAIVPGGYASATVLLVWDDADRGDDPADWANVKELAPVLPTGGGTLVANLKQLGVGNGQVCSVMVVQRFRPLQMLKMTSKKTYVDTGIPDSKCYRVRLGFYGTESAGGNGGAFENLIGTGDTATGEPFTIGMNGSNFSSWYWVYRSYKANERPAVSTTSINKVDAGNGAFSLNGKVVKSGLAAGPVGISGRNMLLGTIPGLTRFLFGWWSYVRFDDADGEAILDYVPAKREADGAVGFYDRATGSFVLSTGGGAFTAGEETGEGITTVVRTRQNVLVRTLTSLDVSLDGLTLKVTASAAFADESLVLLWDDADRGRDVGAWAHQQTIVAAVPAAGGNYEVDLSTLDIGRNQVCCVAAVQQMALLDKLEMPDETTFVDTGVPDSQCWSVAFGFYGTSYQSVDKGWGNVIGSYELNNSTAAPGFAVGMDNEKVDGWYWAWQGMKKYPRPTVRTDAINDAVFANQAFTLNGTVINSSLEAGAVGLTGLNMHVGTWASRTRFLFGWWSYVRFADAGGNALLDYVPAKRLSDGKVGFFDRASGAFVFSTGGGDFTAGNVTNESASAVTVRQTLSLANVVAAAAWTGEGVAGKLDDPANWACTNPYGEEITGVPNAFTDVSFASAADFNCPVGTPFGCRSITMSGSLASDRDWRGIDFSAVNGTIDLAGHDLQAFVAKDLTAATVTDSVGGGTLALEVPAGVKVENANVTLTGGLKLAKVGEGAFVAAKKNQSYTGGTEVLDGTFMCGGKGSEGVYGAADGTLTVGPGAAFDCNGYNGHAAAKLVLAGGALVNTKSVPSSNDGWFADVTLTADSFARADKGLAFQAASGGSATLEMNGHKLTIDVDPNYTFGLYDLTVTGGGTIYGRSGGFIQLVRVTAETTTLEAGSHSLDVSSPTTFLNYIARYTGSWDKSPNAPIRVLGRFMPVGSSWHSVEFQDGAVLDLSQKSGVWSATCEMPHYTGPSSLSFADGATVTIDVGERQPVLGDQLISWPTKPMGAKFSWDLDLPLHAKSKGLFVMERPGTAILIR